MSTVNVVNRSSSTRAAPAVVLGVMCAGMFFVLLDVTVVNVALPAIGHDVGGGSATLQWVVDGYVVAIAGLLPAAGPVGDRIGHRPVVLTGFAVFGAASLACALAPTAAALIGARVVQGIGAALLLPSTLAVIVHAYPEAGARSRALGVWAAASSLALPAGPLLGGLLVDRYGWRPVFGINVPLGVAAMVGSAVVVAKRTGGSREGLDVLGTVALLMGLVGAVFTVIALGHGQGRVTVLGAVAVTVPALGVAWWSAGRARYPVLPPDLLRTREFLAPNLVALIMNLVVNGLLFVCMLYLQNVRGWPPVWAGAAVLPLAVPLVVLAPLSGGLTARRGPRTAVATGCVLAIAGSLLFARLPEGGIGWLLAGFAVLGCGAGLVTAAAVAAVVQATPPDRPGVATSVSNTARQTGTALGVAVFGVLAGPPTGPRFLGALHLISWSAAALWSVALLASLLGIPGGAAHRAAAATSSHSPDPISAAGR
ncbi:MFS transporter [Nocardia sp. NBC_00416]|uniref:MFS transporter n=1 Tax=Nocardia sp. NBC_00416 TaxID=2975991 RepID=UPI002E1C4C46